jgi:hypothetical protein
MRSLVLALVLGVICLNKPKLFGQELWFSFSQDRYTYVWSDTLRWEPEFGGRKPLLFSNASSAVLIKESLLLGNEDRWQENSRSRFGWRFSDGRKFNVTAIFDNDYRSFEERIVVDNSVGLSAEYRPAAGLALRNVGSFITSARDNFGNKYRSSGYRNQLDAAYDSRISQSTAFKADYSQDLKVIPDIPTTNFAGSASFHSIGLDDSIRITMRGAYQNSKYFTTPQSFESISRQGRSNAGANMLLGWEPIENTYLRLQSNLDYRQFRYKHYGSDQLEISSGLLGSDNSSMILDYRLSATRYVGRGLAIETHYMYRETEDDYSSLSARQNVETAELRGAIRSNPGIIDSVWAEAIFSATCYSSDQERSFFSDRDRIMRLYRLGISHRLNPCLALRIDGSFRDFHQTYVSGTLSANNNHNTVYVVRPEVGWRPFPWFTISNSFLLHANYIWYDYEKETESERNTLFRRARWTSEYRVIVSRRLTLRPSYTYKYEDFGQLLWRDQWVQKTNWYRRTHLPLLELSYRPWRTLRIDPGVLYEWKESWEFAVDEDGVVDRIETEVFKRTAIHVDVNYLPGPRTSIVVSYLRRVQKSDLFADDITNQYIVNVYRLF